MAEDPLNKLLDSIIAGTGLNHDAVLRTEMIEFILREMDNNARIAFLAAALSNYICLFKPKDRQTALDVTIDRMVRGVKKISELQGNG